MEGKCNEFSRNFKGKECMYTTLEKHDQFVQHKLGQVPIYEAQVKILYWQIFLTIHHISKGDPFQIRLWKQNNLPSHYNMSGPYKNLLFPTANNFTLRHVNTNNSWFHEIETLYYVYIIQVTYFLQNSLSTYTRSKF